jgi:2-polyprenyl-6-hydroxyphenyl methylase/3-demethylubiquinone-9 3-methyltransferase
MERNHHMSTRFRFGKNWQAFLSVLDAERILEAKRSLKEMLGGNNFEGLRFLDIGSGSGLFSLAAHELGAYVHSFDFDLDSVACTKSLQATFANSSDRWKVEQGSVLDNSYLKTLGTFDIVYSWGVLHHTGQMYQALENVTCLVKPQGQLFIAIYNDQGFLSTFWTFIKKTYSSSGGIIRGLLLSMFAVLFEAARFFQRLLSGKNPLPWVAWREKKQARGMSEWYDLVDWVGGYPFEVAKPEEIFEFYKSRGFQLERLVTKRGGQGCCEYVFRKVGSP